MSVAIESARIGTGRLRMLLAGDRGSAGETRQGKGLTALQTTAYQKPLRVWLRVRWRRYRQRRILAFSSSLIFVLALGISLVVARRAGGEAHAFEAAGQLTHALTAPVQAAKTSALLAPVRPAADVQNGSQKARAPHALSPRRRLQRADLWLRVQTARGAVEARQLLESALVELPTSAHGHAALAEACVRLDDANCAHDAIQKALEARPKRAKYRALAAKISDAFTATAR